MRHKLLLILSSPSLHDHRKLSLLLIYIYIILEHYFIRPTKSIDSLIYACWYACQDFLCHSIQEKIHCCFPVVVTVLVGHLSQMFDFTHFIQGSVSSLSLCLSVYSFVAFSLKRVLQKSMSDIFSSYRTWDSFCRFIWYCCCSCCRFRCSAKQIVIQVVCFVIYKLVDFQDCLIWKLKSGRCFSSIINSNSRQAWRPAWNSSSILVSHSSVSFRFPFNYEVSFWP